MIRQDKRDLALPSISVFTPSFNHAPFLEDTIRSVLDQNYPGLEYMVFDGGSTDGSVDIIHRYQDRLAFWVSERDGGQAFALNHALSRVTGDVIGWLNSDDVYLPGVLEKVGRIFADNPDVMLVHGDCIAIDQDGNILTPLRHGPSSPEKLAHRCVITQMSTFFRRSVIEKLGVFDTTFRYAMDYDYWLRISAAFPDGIFHLPEPLSYYRMHEQSQSVRDILPALFVAIDVRRKLVAAQPRPDWLENISGDIFRQPLVDLLGAATDPAAVGPALDRLRTVMGDLFKAEDWRALQHFLTDARLDAATRRAGLALLTRIERCWIIACGGIETPGHDVWLAGALVELGWRHLRRGHTARGLSLFAQAVARHPAILGPILRWRLVEMLVRACVGKGAFLFLRGIKRRAMGLFLPGTSR